MDELMGTIKLFAGDFYPKNYMLCNGQLLLMGQYSALYSIIGNMYGGDGQNTFALPNLNGKVALGTGQAPGSTFYRIAQTGGNDKVTLQLENMPVHNHTAQLSVSSANATENIPVAQSSIAVPGTSEGREFTSTLGFNTESPDILMNNQAVKTDPAGGGLAFSNMQPFMALNYIICIQGIYPSRP